MMTTARCLFCGDWYVGNFADHLSRCDGRQGRIESQPDEPRSTVTATLGDDPLYGRMGDVGYERGSDTSESAAASISADALTRMESRVLAVIRARPTTCDQVEVLTGLSHQTASSTIRRLVLRGRLVDSGRRETNRSGRKGTVWIAA